MQHKPEQFKKSTPKAVDSTNALINAGKLPKREQGEPSKKDLERKFTMRIDR